MQYTVWSRGTLIGTTTLEFKTLGFDRARSGHFHPSALGIALLDELSSDTHCMRAFMHRNYRDEKGQGILDPDYINSDWFADIAEHLQRCASYALELRDESNAVVAVLEIGIQDREPGFRERISTTHEGDAQKEDDWEMQKILDHLRRREAERELRMSTEDGDISGASAPGDDMKFDAPSDALHDLYGDDDGWNDCDVTVPVGWGYEDQRGDYELGSGWNTTIRNLPHFPRYQIHVVLSE